MKLRPVDQSKRIASRGLSFGIVADSAAFPPRDILNAFFSCGYDDLPAERVLRWPPFTLSPAQYATFFRWWKSTHARARLSRLRVKHSDFQRWFTRAVDRRASATTHSTSAAKHQRTP
jgi:hypothetical protein